MEKQEQMNTGAQGETGAQGLTGAQNQGNVGPEGPS
jgi:hypothetical protein